MIYSHSFTQYHDKSEYQNIKSYSNHYPIQTELFDLTSTFGSTRESLVVNGGVLVVGTNFCDQSMNSTQHDSTAARLG